MTEFEQKTKLFESILSCKEEDRVLWGKTTTEGEEKSQRGGGRAEARETCFTVPPRIKKVTGGGV